MLNQTEPHIRDSCRLHWSASVTTSSSRVGPGHGEVWVGAAEANWDPGSRADPFPSSDDVCQNLHCSEVQLCPGLGDRMGKRLRARTQFYQTCHLAGQSGQQCMKPWVEIN